MKNLGSILCILTVALFVACGEETPVHDAVENGESRTNGISANLPSLDTQDRPEIFEYSEDSPTVHIAVATEEILQKFGYIHETTHLILVEHLQGRFRNWAVRGGFSPNLRFPNVFNQLDMDGVDLLIWADEPVQLLSLVAFFSDEWQGVSLHVPFENFYRFGEIRPREAVIIRDFQNLGFFNTGISFSTNNPLHNEVTFAIHGLDGWDVSQIYLENPNNENLEDWWSELWRGERTFLTGEPLESAENFAAQFETPHFSDEFLAAIQAYFMGGERSESPAFSPRIISHIVDVDGNGTMGVLAVRHEASNWYGVIPMGRVFYTIDNLVLYEDVGVQDFGFGSGVTAAGRLVNIGMEGGITAYTLFEIIDGRLTQTSMFSSELDFPSDTVPFSFFFFPTRPDFSDLAFEQSYFEITEEEFFEISVQYGFDNARMIWHLEDHTERILSAPAQ
ncbi:MAG: hypothetical protein FWG65_06735 [Turicibacter sp.]|nr:hypothetical protein [Turicibacter sp.]